MKLYAHHVPGWLHSMYSSRLIWSKQAENTIYLTFDDGPHPVITPWLLDLLKSFNASATFFLLGKNIRKYPHLVDRMVHHGHVIGNHKYNHLNGWITREKTYVDDIEECQTIIRKHSNNCQFFRPPYGKITRTQVSRLAGTYEIVLWNWMTGDFDQQLNLSKVQGRLSLAKPGSIIVFHENEKSKKNLQWLLPRILTDFQLKGYNFKQLD